MLHNSIPLADRHAPHNYEYADTAARIGATGFVSGDLGKLALQIDDSTLWILTATVPTWRELGAPGATGAPGVDALIELDPNGDSGSFYQKLDFGSRWTMVIDGGNAAGVVTLPSSGYPAMVLMVSSPTVVEGNPLIHTITLSATTTVNMLFPITLGGGTAAGGGIDYSTPPAFSNGVTQTGGDITIPSGVSSFSITVTTVNDNVVDGTKTYNLTVGGVTGVGTMTDADAPAPPSNPEDFVFPDPGASTSPNFVF